MHKNTLNVISIALLGLACFVPMRDMLLGFIIGVVLTNSLFIIITKE